MGLGENEAKLLLSHYGALPTGIGAGGAHPRTLGLGQLHLHLPGCSHGENAFLCTGIPTLQHHGGDTPFVGCQEELVVFY